MGDVRADEAPAAELDGNLQRVVTLPQVLGVSFHEIVGGGVVSLTGVAIALTGGGRRRRPDLLAKPSFTLPDRLHLGLVIVGTLINLYLTYLLVQTRSAPALIAIGVWILAGLVWSVARWPRVRRLVHRPHPTPAPTARPTVQ